MEERILATRPGLLHAMEEGIAVAIGTAAWGAFVRGPSSRALPVRLLGLADREAAWLVGFERMTIATGARDVVLPFPAWTLPGVMGAQRSDSALRLYTAFTGRRIVIIGGGVTGLSTVFWLAREGHPVTVVERGIVGWEASGRNGGGCTHPYSPLFREEQRLWPMMDELLGHRMEWRPNCIKVALDDGQLDRLWKSTGLATDQGFAAAALDRAALRELVPWVGDRALAPYSGSMAAMPIRNAPAKPMPGPWSASAGASCSTRRCAASGPGAALRWRSKPAREKSAATPSSSPPVRTRRH